MLLGYNHNIQYAGHTFHVQTEDSGAPSYTITTELFLGGVVISNLKDVYADPLEKRSKDTLRKRMQDQHKAMMKSLINGLFDIAIAHQAPSSR